MKHQLCLLFLSVLVFLGNCQPSSEPSPQPNSPNPQPAVVPVIPQPQPGVVPVVPQPIPEPGVVPVIPQPQPGVVPVIPQPIPEPGVVPVIPQPQPGVVPVIPSPQPSVVPVVPTPQPSVVPVVPSPQPSVVPVVPTPQPSIVPVVPSPQPGVVPVVPSPQPGVVPVVPSPQPGVVPVVPSPQPGVVPVVPSPQPGVVPVVPSPQPGVVPVVPSPQPGVVPVVPSPQPGVVPVVPSPQPGVVPVVPSPGVEPTPEIQPKPAPLPYTPSEFFFSSLSNPSPFPPTSFGAVHYTNHSLFFFGGNETGSIMSSQIIQYNLLNSSWFNFNNWDIGKSIICYSQPESDTITNYPTYFIWANSTNLSYYLTFFDTNLDFNQTILLPGSGSHMDISLAASPSGSAFILEENSFNIYYFNVSTNNFVAIVLGDSPSSPVPRYNPAVVAYNNGFYMHGGSYGGVARSDLWYFDYTYSNWTSLGNIFSAYEHKAHIIDIGANSTIYFVGVNDSSGIYIYDINTNTYIPFKTAAKSPRYGSVSSIQGNRLYLFGGENTNNQVWRFIDERYCTARDNCTSCSSAYSCGWCPSPNATVAPCITALESTSLLNNTCLVQSVFTHSLLCDEYEFPKAAIAFINLGIMAIFGVIVFIIIKVRSNKQKAGKGYAAV